MRAQISATRDAAFRLARAHIDLAKAEATTIGGQIARVAALAGIAIAVVIVAVLLLIIGTSLFLGEWLLGSMGWGVLHGLLLFVGIALACGLAAVGVSGTRLARALAAGVAVGILFALIFGLALPNQVYARIGDALVPGVEPGVRPLVVGAAIWGLLGLAGGIFAALRLDAAGPRVAALLGLTVFGLIFGAFTANTFGWQVSIGLGITAGYLTWIALMAIDIARTGVDVEALKARFYPTQTIETSKETLEWLQKRMPPGIGS
ncbi:MAG TPA: hypothetical protein VD763_07050 [Candidatus Saccharimonadales bacterium]|nr:hypothetical protein [Candidatus Saccharimonadales bacterium]